MDAKADVTSDIRTLVVPLDGSAEAERALPLAAVLARSAGCKLRFVQSAGKSRGAAGTAAEANQYLRSQRDSALYGALDVTIRADEQAPRDLIVDEASQPGAWAVVMSTHGRTGVRKLVTGSVATEVLRSAPVPVYLMPPAAPPVAQHLPIRSVLVAWDGTPDAYDALRPVADMAALAKAEIVLLRVLGKGAAAQDGDDIFGPIENGLAAAGLRSRSLTAEGELAEQLLAAAQEQRVSLIAMATHDRSGLLLSRHESATEAVLRQATVPVMVLGAKAIQRFIAG